MGELAREVDVVVVGGGPGGYSAAFRCAELGLETVVIDADRRLGGVCLHAGCIPSKAMLRAAAVIADAERAREWGVELGPARVSPDVLRAWIAERVIGPLTRGLESIARARSVEVIGGRAAFEDSRAVRVVGEAAQTIRFAHAIVATGSCPAPLAGVALGPRIMDSTAALRLPDIPERLLVVGAGCAGLELGTAYAALGSRVTLAEAQGGLLPGVDRDLTRVLARRIEARFAAVHVGARVTALADAGDGVEAEIEGQARQRFDRALLAVGRRPATSGLGLERTRARLQPDGAIGVDEAGRTGDPHIYAVGDVTGPPMLAHRAMRQGAVAAEAIAGRPAAFDAVAVPAVVFTDPEVAWCGLTEAEAERTGRPVKIARVPWAASGRAATLGRSDGLTKLLADPGSGRVLGAALVGPGAAELIAEAALAVETAALAEDVALTVHAHPSLAETLMEAAGRLLR